MPASVIISIEDIPEPGSRAFRLETAEGELEGFIVRFAGEVRAYVNSCPHTRVNLNWVEDQFFDVDHKFLQCSMHGALFDPLQGHCVWGPCSGDRLQRLALTLVDGQAVIHP